MRLGMNRRMRQRTTALAWLVIPASALLAGACGGSPPPPPKKPPSDEPVASDYSEPEPEPIETGKDCVTATTECGGGVCLATIKNDCEDPVTCDLQIMASCQTGTTTGEARTKARGTFRPKAEDQMSAAGDCADGEVLFTVAEQMICR